LTQKIPRGRFSDIGRKKYVVYSETLTRKDYPMKKLKDIYMSLIWAYVGVMTVLGFGAILKDLVIYMRNYQKNKK
jgi:hypothetical protein